MGRLLTKGVVDALNLPETVTTKAKRAYNSTTALQHDLGATLDKARASFGSTVEAMAEVLRVLYPDGMISSPEQNESSIQACRPAE